MLQCRKRKPSLIEDYGVAGRSRAVGQHCLKVVCEMTDNATGRVVGEIAGFDRLPEPELSAAVWRSCELNRSSQATCGPPKMFCVDRGQRPCRGEIVFRLEKTDILLRTARPS